MPKESEMNELPSLNWPEWHERLLRQAGVFKIGSVTDKMIEERFEEFFGLSGVFFEMLSYALRRKILGIFRYEQKDESGLSYDEKAHLGQTLTYIDRMEKEKIKGYRETGNKEFLIDILNYCALEWAKPYHPNAHFKAEDRDT